MTYSDADIGTIAEAAGVDPTEVAKYRRQLEAAALWYRLDTSSPKRIPPSHLLRRIDGVTNQARRLLKALGISDPEEAIDGPQDAAVLHALASAQDRDETEVRQAAERIGRLVEILDAARAAADIERWTTEAANNSVEVGRLIVPAGHQGDTAVNDWIAAMIGIYGEVSGREPGTSVGAPVRQNEGQASGPLIRFLSAAAAPLELVMSPDAWRERVRLVLR